MNKMFLLGRLSAIAGAIDIETKHLIEQDEDEHARLGKLSGMLDVVVGLMEADAVEGAPADVPKP